MFVFWQATNVPATPEAESAARHALATMAGVTGIAQGQHVRGAFRVTLYYSARSDASKMLLRHAAEEQLRQALGIPDVRVEEDLQAYPQK